MYNQKLHPTLNTGHTTGTFAQEQKVGQGNLPYLGMLDFANFDSRRAGDNLAQQQLTPSATELPNNSLPYLRHPDKATQDLYSPFPRNGFLSALNTPITSSLMGC